MQDDTEFSSIGHWGLHPRQGTVEGIIFDNAIKERITTAILEILDPAVANSPCIVDAAPLARDIMANICKALDAPPEQTPAFRRTTLKYPNTASEKAEYSHGERRYEISIDASHIEYEVFANDKLVFSSAQEKTLAQGGVISIAEGTAALAAWKERARDQYLKQLESASIPLGWKSVPREPTRTMIDEAAQRLVSFENGSTWPDSWDEIQVRQARILAERALRSGIAAAPELPKMGEQS